MSYTLKKVTINLPEETVDAITEAGELAFRTPEQHAAYLLTEWARGAIERRQKGEKSAPAPSNGRRAGGLEPSPVS